MSKNICEDIATLDIDNADAIIKNLNEQFGDLKNPVDPSDMEEQVTKILGKEIKDVLAYLRLIVNPNDEESLKRIINYPTRGIGVTTIDKLIIASKENNLTLFEVIQNLWKLKISINKGTMDKLNGFLNIIRSFQIENEKLNADDGHDGPNLPYNIQKRWQ
jgi:DNA helicase-2/ATP-dependent DNA helicase PcrA